MELLSNPFIVAALIGAGTYYAVQTYKPAFLLGYEWATPMNVGFAAAVFYITFVWWQGDVRLPILGRRLPSIPVPVTAPPSAAELAARVKSASRSMSDLLGPDQF